MWLREMRDRWADLLSAARVAYYRLMGITIGVVSAFVCVPIAG